MSQTILAIRMAEVMERNGRPMRIKEIAAHFPEKPESTIRGRLYRFLGDKFKRVDRGVYMVLSEEGAAYVIEGDGRDLSAFKDESIDSIISDHPWKDEKSNSGGNRHFDSSYEDTSFRYTLEDFKEKARVLKEGAFLVEVLPAENENNFKYLYQLKMMAEEAGLMYYAKVPWSATRC